MKANRSTSRYENVKFVFYGHDKREPVAELRGTVDERNGEMVLTIEDDDAFDVYLIIGKPCEHWFKGTNSHPDRDRANEMAAKWSRIGNEYIGRWNEGDDFLFSFQLGEATKLQS